MDSMFHMEIIKIEIINKNHLDIIHDLIKDVIFKCSDFRESIINVEYGDFLYLDPPYVPEKTHHL